MEYFNLILTVVIMSLFIKGSFDLIDYVFAKWETKIAKKGKQMTYTVRGLKFTNEDGKGSDFAPVAPEDVWERVKSCRDGILTLKGSKIGPMDILTILLGSKETYASLRKHFANSLTEEEVANTLIALWQLAENVAIPVINETHDD